MLIARENVENLNLHNFCVYIAIDWKFGGKFCMVFINVCVEVESLELNTLTNKCKLRICVGVGRDSLYF